jgi:MarR family transcriptional regulator, organic hydroperoxide resistance regulator
MVFDRARIPSGKGTHANSVRIAFRAFARVLTVVCSNGDITPAQYRVLRVLEQAPGFTQLELARFTGMERPFVSLIIKQLRQAGLVSTKASTQDGRRIDVVLTAKGRKVRDRLLAVLRPSDDAAVKGVADRDLATFHAVLERMTRNVEAYADQLESGKRARR